MKYIISMIMISSTVALARTGDIAYEYEPEWQMKQAEQFVQRDPSSVDWVKKQENSENPDARAKAIEWKKFNKDYWQ